MEPEELTFTVTHKILKIVQSVNNYPARSKLKVLYESEVVNYRKNYKLALKINKNDDRNYACSDIVGGMFAARYNFGQKTVKLLLCGLPSKNQVAGDDFVDGIEAQWTVHIKEADLWYHKVATFKYGYSPHIVKGVTISTDTFDMDEDDYKDMDGFTFEIDVEILYEYGVNGKVIGRLSEEKKWDDYIRNGGGIAQVIKTDGFKAIRSTPASAKTNVIHLPPPKTAANIAFENWLKRINLRQYYGILAVNGYDDLEKVLDINMDQMKEIGIEVEEDRQKLMHYIQSLSVRNGSNGHGSGMIEDETPEPEFVPYIERNTKNNKRLYYQHVSMHKEFNNISTEEMRSDDLYGKEDKQNKEGGNDTVRNKESNPWWMGIAAMFMEGS